MKIKLTDQKRQGLLAEHRGVTRPLRVTHDHVRLTIPAREALEQSGASIVAEGRGTEHQSYSVTFGAQVPAGIIACHTINVVGIAIRLDVEPPYPGEIDAFWERLDFTPCPKCGAALIWYEAGYVPGYRVCANKPHHHWLAE